MNIETYSSNLEITFNDKRSGFTLDFDQKQGQFTRSEWFENINEDFSDWDLSREEISEILDALESTCNDNFFEEE